MPDMGGCRRGLQEFPSVEGGASGALIIYAGDVAVQI